MSRLSDLQKNMKCFFHADTEIYSNALRRALITVLVPLSGVCAFCTINIIIHYDWGLSRLFAIIIAASVLLGMVFAFSAVYITEKKKRRHARFTFFDIFPTGIVFSEYAGEFIHTRPEKHTPRAYCTRQNPRIPPRKRPSGLSH